ncbi:MAG: tetratricopeptide repeat protein [Chloroflexia bacterium]
MKQAIYLFEQALSKDRNYALAYAGLADCYALLSWYNSPPPPDAFPKAKEAAMRAIQLDEGLAEAHASLAFVLLYYERDWAGAEREFRRAIELNPSYATAHHWYAFNLAAMGRHNEALAEIKRAQELDPNSLIIGTAVANVLYYARQYDQTIAQCLRTLEADAGFIPAYMVLRGAYTSKGLHDEAAAILQKENSYAGDHLGRWRGWLTCTPPPAVATKHTPRSASCAGSAGNSRSSPTRLRQFTPS